MKVTRNDLVSNNKSLKYNYSSPDKIEKKASGKILTHSIRSDKSSIMEKVFEELTKIAKTEGNSALEFWKLSEDGTEIERAVPVDENNIAIKE